MHDAVAAGVFLRADRCELGKRLRTRDRDPDGDAGVTEHGVLDLVAKLGELVDGAPEPYETLVDRIDLLPRSVPADQLHDPRTQRAIQLVIRRPHYDVVQLAPGFDLEIGLAHQSRVKTLCLGAGSDDAAVVISE